MNKKLKLGISAFAGYGAAGLVGRLAKATKTGTGSTMVDAGIMFFEAVVFIGVTGYASTVIDVISEAFDKAKKEEENEEKEEGVEGGSE